MLVKQGVTCWTDLDTIFRYLNFKILVVVSLAEIIKSLISMVAMG